MKYTYIPNTYNNHSIQEKFTSETQFLQCQVLYKTWFENMLNKSFPLQKIEDYIRAQNVDIPKIEDVTYNFYHRFSKLGSDYIYIRNNYHVENLTFEEIEQLEQQKLSDTFFSNSYERVLYEEGMETFLGTPMDETRVNSKSLVFVFAFDQSQCESVAQFNTIQEIIKQCFTMLDALLKPLPIEKSYVVYNGIPDLFS